MATIADLEVKKLEEHLIAGGFLAAFTDILGNSQPKPIFQAFELDLTNVSASSRVVMMRESGNVTSVTRTFFKERPMVIVVTSKGVAADSIIARGLSEDMEKYLVDNPNDGAYLVNIESSGVSGPFILPDSRRAFEINISVMFNI